MKLVFHGGAQQVGRSCIELETQGDRYLMDCGVRFVEDGFEYPADVIGVKDIDGVLLSHAHLDHSGALPFFEHLNLLCPIFMTPVTKPIIRILLKDSYKIARIKNMHPAFAQADLKKVRGAIKDVQYDKQYHFRKIDFTYFNAGHIPGSASILIEAENHRLLYSGDLNTRENNLVIQPNTKGYGPIDTLITESTYGARKLPPRAPLEEEFLDKIAEVIKKGGRVLIPVFALGRAQEILIMLSKRKWNVPIYFDGMCKQITRKILTSHTPYVKNKDILNKMYFDVVQYVSSPKMRDAIASKTGIFVCTSGMVQGGPAIYYLKHMWHDEKAAVLLTGYQVEHTNGWLLSEKNQYYYKGWRSSVKCFVKRYDFSGHLDQDDLHQYILDVNPKTLIIQHGNEEAIENLATWARKNTKCKVYAPKVGDEIIIE